MKDKPTLEQMPKIPAGLDFTLDKVDTVCLPHPYCITPRHLTGKSMYLDQAAIEDAEKTNGARCDICAELVRSGRQSRILSYAEHEQQLTLFIKVPQNKDLNAIKGLHKYLFDNKAKFAELGIQGFAFPTK